MRYGYVALCLAFCSIFSWAASGCHNSQPAATARAPAQEETKLPAAEAARESVREFLEAVRTGNGEKAEAMFTVTARKELAELKDIHVAPQASDTAKFEVGAAEMLDEDGARVPCTWSDLDKNGAMQTNDMTWMIRKEPEGWRIAGMAAVVFEGEDPLLLDFEKPQETLQKIERLSKEIGRRRAKAAQETVAGKPDGLGQAANQSNPPSIKMQPPADYSHAEVAQPTTNNGIATPMAANQPEKSSETTRR
jgi:hypothetical protein